MSPINKLLSLPLLLALAGPVAADSARERLAGFYQDVETMAATFEQVRVRDDGRETNRSEGRVSIHRPGRFRFEYTDPYEQLYVSNGDKVWSYDPDLAQVLVRGMDETLGSTPAVLLAGDQPLDDTFSMLESETTDGRRWVELEPRDEAEAQFERVRIGFDDDALRVLEIIDTAGQTSRMTFHDVRYGVEFDDSLFEFVAPEGVDVVDGSER
ncbi:MAG: outer membrane lipoprotein chaperone LolA [Pseudomonadota bacterium]